MVPLATWDNDHLWELALSPAALPSAGFSSSSPDWLGQATVFTNTTQTTPPGDPTMAYHWAFGDSATSPLTSPTHAYTSPGMYTVVLTATNVAGGHVISGTVTVYGPPTTGFTTSSPEWLGQTTTFANTT
ncbi:MAG: PKD domain-containing protein, partial [Chloroflexi bacterium]|nr:PKD domain-containing protein [Chloroflexota bacterium]